jgi:septal ring factor EnvC (AmiA/AmiB activator)
MKIWNIIKSYGKWIIGGILGLFALIAAIGKLRNQKTVEKIQEKIDDNTKKIERVKGNEDQVKTQKLKVKKELTELKETVNKTKATKTTNRKPSHTKRLQLKQNIILFQKLRENNETVNTYIVISNSWLRANSS